MLHIVDTLNIVCGHHIYLGSAEAHVLPHLLGHLHSLLGTSHIILAELDPLLGGGGPTTVAMTDLCFSS